MVLQWHTWKYPSHFLYDVDVDFLLFFLIYFFGLDTKYPIASPPELFFFSQIFKIDQTFHVSISDTIRLTNS